MSAANPSSDEAKKAGCECVALEWQIEPGEWYDRDSPEFIVAERCPLHGRTAWDTLAELRSLVRPDTSPGVATGGE